MPMEAKGRLTRVEMFKVWNYINSNLEKLSVMHIQQIADTINHDLGLTTTRDTITGLVKDMGMEPFWQRKPMQTSVKHDRIQAFAKSLLIMHDVLSRIIHRLEEVDIVTLQRAAQRRGPDTV